MTDATAAPKRHSPAAVLGAIVGTPILAFGFWGAFSDRSDTHPFELARWVIAADLAHDLVWAPSAIALGWLVGRLAPPVLRGPCRWALASTAVLTLYAWPFLRGYGRNRSVPSLLDRNYATGLISYLAVVWIVAAAWGAVAWRRRTT